jgi:hypothetical protein
VDLFQCLALNVVLRDNPLARAAVGNTSLRTQVIEHILTADTETRLQTCSAIVNTGVDDLAVARARLCTDGRMPLNEHGRRALTLRELPSNSEAYNTATNDLENR